MEASQLKINPDHLRFKPMAKGKRSQLRRENIKALIRSKPAGTTITNAEFALATKSDPSSCYAMIKTMVKHGEIRKIQSEHKRNQHYYEVFDDVKVKVPATQSSLKEIVARLPIPAPNPADNSALI